MATGGGAGLRIAGYTDVVEVGRGGFAVVHRARRVAFGQDVAIKVLDRAQGDAGADGHRDRRGRVGARHHPLLVTVLLRDEAGTVVAAERSAQATTAGGGATLIRLDPAGSQPMSVRLLSVPPAARTAECYPEYVRPLR